MASTSSSSSAAAAVRTLWWRELVRFFRQPSRVASAVLTPLIFWLLLGLGLDRTFVVGDAVAGGPGYLAYFFPGIVMMIVLFTAIFSTITVIEERREGFLQGVLVSPAPRLALVLGKVLGGATIAWVQAMAAVIVIWPLVVGVPGPVAVLAAAIVLAILSVALTAGGLAMAWPMTSTAAFHAIMMLILMPMWMLCGAVFPLATAPAPLKVLMFANPLTYGYATLAAVLTGPAAGAWIMPVVIALPVTLALTVLAIALATRIARR